MSLQLNRKSFSEAILAVLVPFYLLLLGAATWTHTFWRDESSPWLVARDSGVRELLRASHYDGHPPLWFFVVKLVTHFTRNPEAIKLPNLLFTLAVATMILCATLLAPAVRLALIFSYFLLFEYGLIDRNYMIGVAFVVAAALWAHRPGTDLRFSLALSCAALTSLPAFILSICLYAYFLLLHRTQPWNRIRRVALGIYVATAVATAAILYPPADSGSFLLREHASAVARLVSAFHALAAAYLPIPGYRVQFWNITLLSRGPWYLEPLAGGCLGLGLAILFPKSLERRFFLTASGLLLALGMFTGRTQLRHVGWLFIALVVTLLLLANRRSVPLQFAGWRKWLFAALLGLQAACGIYAASVGLIRPFSSSKQVADYLRQQHLEQAPIIFAPGVTGLSVITYLRRAAYYPEVHTQASYVVWDRNLLLGAHMPSREEVDMLTAQGGPALVISETPLAPQTCQELNVRLLQSFHGAIARDYTYYVYRQATPAVTAAAIAATCTP